MPDGSPEVEQVGFSLRGREQVETAWTVVNITGMAPTASSLLNVIINTLSSDRNGNAGISVGGETGDTMRKELVTSLHFIVDNPAPESRILESAKGLLEILEGKTE